MSLFNNIRSVPRVGTEQADVLRRITEFIVRRCAPIISHRLRSDKFIFHDMTLDKILQGWEPSNSDHFVETDCKIPQRLALLVQSMGIKCRQSNGKYFVSWAKESAPVWMKIFLLILSSCKDCFKMEGKKVAGDTIKGATAIRLLQAMVGTEVFKYLLELESVSGMLDQQVFKHRRGTIF
jgi:hypothetical protein